MSLSPAYLAFVILFGVLLGFAIVSMLGMKWRTGITATIYVAALAWSVLLTWWHRHDMPRFNRIDLLISAFVLAILTSIVLNGRLSDLISGYPRYLPFLLVAPYLCGRLMKQSDIRVLANMLTYVGLTFLPLLVLDAHRASLSIGRYPFFGINHTPVLVNSLLAFSLVALATWDQMNDRPAFRPWQSAMQYSLMGVLVGFMVWVAARGWIMASVLGFLALLSGSLQNCNLRKIYFMRFVFVLAMIWLSLAIMPNTHHFYARLMFDPTISGVRAAHNLSPDRKFGPILGAASCSPIVEGVDSVKIRWVLYQEALAQFIQSPVTGDGAGLFGEQSCLGNGSYPHSTVLQSFSELGMIGGLPLVMLYAMATVTLFRMIALEKHSSDKVSMLLVFALTTMLLMADQIYGNYFMASGTYFIFGVIASMRGRIIKI